MIAAQIAMRGELLQVVMPVLYVASSVALVAVLLLPFVDAAQHSREALRRLERRRLWRATKGRVS